MKELPDVNSQTSVSMFQSKDVILWYLKVETALNLY